MTGPERNAELIKRLRITLRLFKGDCNDRELMAFARAVRPLTFARVSSQLWMGIMRDKFVMFICFPFGDDTQDHGEGKYRVLYETAEAQNRCYVRRIAGLRSRIAVLQKECRENHQRDVSEG